MEADYIINSHVGYTKPLEMLLASMEHIDPRRIFIFIGGAEKEQIHVRMRDGLLTFYVTHDSYDYTGLITLIEKRLITAEHIFCLQDTMLFGPTSDTLICNANPHAEATAAHGWQCNLVLYRRDYVLHREKFIRSMKNCSKQDSITYEGWLWKASSNRAEYVGTDCIQQGYEFPYNPETRRLKEYYPAVDIIKYKGNWGQNMNDLVVTP